MGQYEEKRPSRCLLTPVEMMAKLTINDHVTVSFIFFANALELAIRHSSNTSAARLRTPFHSAISRQQQRRSAHVGVTHLATDAHVHAFRQDLEL